jgi:hypothetical protein
LLFFSKKDAIIKIRGHFFFDSSIHKKQLFVRNYTIRLSDSKSYQELRDDNGVAVLGARESDFCNIPKPDKPKPNKGRICNLAHRKL